MKSFRNSFLSQKHISQKHSDFMVPNYDAESKPGVLIADRNIKVGKNLKSFFVSKSFNAILVDRWKYLLLELQREDIVLLFLDVKLMDLPGYKLIPIIKKIRPDIYIVMTNETNTMEVESVIRNYQILFYCLKPYDLHEIDLLIKDGICEY